MQSEKHIPRETNIFSFCRFSLQKDETRHIERDIEQKKTKNCSIYKKITIASKLYEYIKTMANVVRHLSHIYLLGDSKMRNTV